MIDIGRINNVSPYKVQPAKTDNFFEFVTDYGVRYSIGFMPDDGLLSVEAYHFIIANMENKPSPKDEKVRLTVMVCIEEFFARKNNVMLYICETGDGKQAVRNRLFHYWFSQYENRSLFTCLTSSVIDEDDNTNYATLLVRNDNPMLAKIIFEFSETVAALNSKPN